MGDFVELVKPKKEIDMGEKEVYYFLVRKFNGGIYDAIMALSLSLSISNKINERKFAVYSSEEKAIEAGERSPFVYTIMRIEFGGEHPHPTIIEEHFYKGEKIKHEIGVKIVKEDLLIIDN